MTLAKNDPQATGLSHTTPVGAATQREAQATPPLTMQISGKLSGRGTRLPQQKDIKLDPELQEQLTALFQHGQYQQAATQCAELLNSHRKSAFLWELLGRCHLAQTALDEAATCLNKACELNPTSATTFAAMGDVYRLQNRSEDAVALYRKALALDSTCLPALNNLGNTLLDQDRIIEADQCFANAIDQAPDNAQLLYNRANIQRQLGNLGIARDLYGQAARFAPGFLEARYNLAQLTGMAGDRVEAIRNLEQILLARPNDDRARAQKLRLMADLCDWRWLDEYQDHRRHLGLRGSACAPQAQIGLEDNPDLLRIRMQAHASAGLQADPAPQRPRAETRPQQLRVGYFVSSAQDLDALRLLDSLLARHDQSRFSLYVYTASAPRADLVGVLHRDIRGLSPTTIKTQAVADQLDIAIDLTSYTHEADATVFSARIAPVQVAMPGFPGTMGTPTYDYILGDAITCPPGSERYFEEHLIRLPHSYLSISGPQDLSGHQFSRRDCGLPDEAFVFCSFTASHAVTPREFDIWMRLLTKIDGSVLWLADYAEEAQAALRTAAGDRSVDPSRLIFAAPCTGEERMARSMVADLFLDSFTLNAGPAARDALVAGLPVLTMAGRQFAARTTASLLAAADMEELVTTTPQAYEARAQTLAGDRDQLMALRSKLRLMQSKAPLFDTARYMQDLERGLDIVFARHCDALPPQHVAVPAEDPLPKPPVDRFSHGKVAVPPIHAA
ncbi:putative UDP-N-acetylglucosamine-peptide N-acetylglucosaminyltransferase [Phaeobacter piscinae]|uniref:protein O-GlcNAc transferase n=1 Tax=Phaeobacter piscinae TaxID=1580596 RepID=A0ABM6PH60_9RHOB|nr:tetratricopeptide repeat protein [Phaeobacter piscinae]ATG37032.1 putative UDP-N-acetylglucosamine-peptide N-acetylglucosaminyltransferase [Phaeobacter piscinae]AUQ87553.1 putative UDP-N-acetylglucosamine-peptide N-acetylglucosaminyltransferase [Phaeobacter piscinae]AUR25436.1 putative UDP-N-acetylglucosamine-peptide N-acetylglucosaminyltransferase [Phaeobacter piscinae]